MCLQWGCNASHLEHHLIILTTGEVNTVIGLFSVKCLQEIAEDMLSHTSDESLQAIVLMQNKFTILVTDQFISEFAM